VGTYNFSDDWRSMSTFFTADLHFGHGNIIKHCARPFKDAEEMDRELIKNWNSVVGAEDHVFILGDFSVKWKMTKERCEYLLHELRGLKHLILGNHDITDPVFLTECGFYSVHYPALTVGDFICVHDPALSQVDNRSKKFLCGHVHNLFLQQKNAFNVGVDMHNYTPVRLEEIQELWEDI